jgi:endonuclease-3
MPRPRSSEKVTSTRPPQRTRATSSGGRAATTAPPSRSPRQRADAVANERRERAAAVHLRLARALPEPRCELDFRSPFELLVATILSAQSTDRTVNAVTPALFARFPTPAALAAAPQEEVEALVHATGFYRNKAKAIRGAAAALVDRFGGEVPRTIADLVTLPGVARKTANVVLGTAFRIASGIAVDTHAGRVARRLELTEHDDPEAVEADLCALFPRADWTDTGHRLVLHGRYVCVARKPRCAQCPLFELCPSRAGDPPSASWEQRAEAEGRLVLARGRSAAASP